MDTNPYSTPSTSFEPIAKQAVHGPYGAFRNNNLLRSFIVSLLIIEAMLTIFVFIIHQIVAPADLHQTGSSLLQILTWIGIGQIATRVSLIVLFCFWINRTCKNGWLLDPPKMKTSPAWAVGYYFIPVLQLWKPFTSMREIRDASYGRRDKLSATLPLWWVFWLALMFIGSITNVLSANTADRESLTMAYKLATVSGPVKIILDYLAIALVLGITRAQNVRVTQWHR